MTDISPKLIPESHTSLSPEEAAREKQRKRDLERNRLADDTQQREAVLLEDTRELFNNLSSYLKGELSTTTEEYKLLERMNLVTVDRYADMTDQASILVSSMKLLQEKYAAMQPQLQKIDEIDAQLEELEKTLFALDNYTLRLENKFKYLKDAKKNTFKKAPPSHVI